MFFSVENEKNKTEEIGRLIARTAQGDMAAFERLYRLTSSSVYSFALSLLAHEQDAEDVMQEVYVAVYRAAAGYREQGKPMAWMLRITKNACLMKLRSAKRTETFSPEETERMLTGTGFAVGKTDELTLSEALSSLDSEERQIVTLHAVAGLLHREIAELLELPLSTVLSKYRRSLVKLKKILEGESV